MSPNAKTTLLETAISLIWNASYAGVGVNEICQQAGVTKGAFYHHFESKADLYCEAALYYWEQMKAQLDTIFSPSRKPLEQLESLINYLIEKQEKRYQDEGVLSGCPFFTSGAQCSEAEEKIRLTSVEMTDRALGYNKALVLGLSAEGMLNEPVDVAQLSRAMFMYIQGLLLYAKIYEDVAAVRRDLGVGLYRILGLKRAYWSDRDGNRNDKERELIA